MHITESYAGQSCTLEVKYAHFLVTAYLTIKQFTTCTCTLMIEDHLASPFIPLLGSFIHASWGGGGGVHAPLANRYELTILLFYVLSVKTCSSPPPPPQQIVRISFLFCCCCLSACRFDRKWGPFSSFLIYLSALTKNPGSTPTLINLQKGLLSK